MIPTTFPTGTGTVTENISWTAEEPATTYDSAVIIAYGSDGLAPKWKPEIERHAKALAAVGILALTPDYFQKSPSTSHDSSLTVFPQIPLRHGSWAIVLRDAVDACKTLPGIDSSKVGLLGFSLGGFLSLRIRDSVDVLVEYFSPFTFPEVDGIGTNANRLLKVHIHHGESDSLVPLMQNANPIQSQLVRERATVSMTKHPGAVHGFLGSDSGNSTARDQSLRETIQFFEANL
ncbi:Dienelactone hydrolase family protein [Rubripirellula lacrimiformis]|uniref:Dienelactone hydrolase family protein n=1 Tax=Rubripirellula lacrimiformis TaxID=1930273 RepID=A0A517N7X5_9BACT|nr:dienelactone hydrolase family protein [Rubripirellula lacrimiformis]QDT03108.1 Dienelactone hydrolase family protein [Rubripirellula lacrimiformis]